MPLGRAKLKALGKNPSDYGYENNRGTGRQGNYWRVGTGDNVAKIAEQVYGNQRMMAEIIRLNGGVSMLKPGMILRLPNFKDNKDIYISNDWASNMGMATTDELKSFYTANPGAYGTGAKATWTSGNQTPFSPDAGYGWGNSSAQAEILARQQKAAAQGLAANNVAGGRGTMVPDYAARTAYMAPGTVVSTTPIGYDPNMRGRGYMAPVTGGVARGTTIKNYSPSQQSTMTGTYMPQNASDAVPPHIPASIVPNPITRGHYIGNTINSGMEGIGKYVTGFPVNAVTASLLAGGSVGQYLFTKVDPYTGQASSASNAVSRLKFFNSISITPDFQGYFNTPVNKNTGQPIGAVQPPTPGFDVGAAAGGAIDAVGKGLGYAGGAWNNLATGSPNGANTPTVAKAAAAGTTPAVATPEQVKQAQLSTALTNAATKGNGGNSEFSMNDYKVIISANLPEMTPTLQAYYLSLVTGVPNTGADIPTASKPKGKWDPYDLGNGYMPTQMEMPGGWRGGGGGGGGNRNIGPSIGMYAWRGL